MKSCWKSVVFFLFRLYCLPDCISSLLFNCLSYLLFNNILSLRMMESERHISQLNNNQIKILIEQTAMHSLHSQDMSIWPWRKCTQVPERSRAGLKCHQGARPIEMILLIEHLCRYLISPTWIYVTKLWYIQANIQQVLQPVPLLNQMLWKCSQRAWNMLGRWVETIFFGGVVNFLFSMSYHPGFTDTNKVVQ